MKAIDEATAIVHQADLESFRKDRAAVLASLTCVHILGEASNHVPPEIKQKYPEVPWNQIRGMRNRIAHEYFEIDESIVWATCKIDFLKLRPLLVKVLDSSDIAPD